MRRKRKPFRIWNTADDEPWFTYHRPIRKDGRETIYRVIEIRDWSDYDDYVRLSALQTMSRAAVCGCSACRNVRNRGHGNNGTLSVGEWRNALSGMDQMEELGYDPRHFRLGKRTRNKKRWW